jgi:hypothetical protein
MRFPAVLLALLLGTAAAVAAPYAVGDAFAGFTTRDQHERAYTYPSGAHLVIVAHAMDSARAANAYLEKQPADFLDRHRAIYLANIHGMPGFVRRFALPKMQKYPHRILLGETKDFLARYPAREDRLTVLILDDAGRITALRFVDPAQELATIFAHTK